MASSLIIFVVAAVASGIMSGSETALLAVNKFRMRHLANSGNHSAQSVMGLMDDYEKTFAAILLTNNVFNMTLAALGTSIAISIWGNHGTTVAAATFATTFILVLFSEITPKTLANPIAERWSLTVARPITVLVALTSPLLYSFTLLPRAILRLMGGTRALVTPSVTEGELRMLIDLGEIEGTVGARRGAMLEGVFRFAETEVGDVMTPRNEIVWVESGTKLVDFLQVYRENQHTRFPVYEDDYDDVVGILSIKDVFRAIADNPTDMDQPVTRLMRSPLFVPETTKLNAVFRTFQQSGQKIALVVDEYGGIDGVVTLTRVLEQIVGRTGEEGTRVVEGFVTIDENTFELDGGIAISELNDRLELDLPEGDYSTIAGFLIEQLQRVPKVGDRVRFGRLRFVVTEMDGNKVVKVRARRRTRVSEPTVAAPG